MNHKQYLNRRSFIKYSAMGTTGLVLGGNVTGNNNQIHKDPKIVTRKLGKTDIVLPIVSFGVMRSDNAALLKSAFEMGYVHFDTAHNYMEGRNEQVLGEVFKSVPRSSLILSTKVSPDDINRQTGLLGPGATKENIIAKFELSLKRLQMNYVDILYCHGVAKRETALAPQIIEAFTEIKKQGKARYVGVSTHMNESEVIQAAIDSNFYDVVLTSFNFKHSSANQIKEKIALAANKGIGIIVMKPMAGAFMDKERQRPIDCSAALKWVLQDTNVTTSIPGITTYDHLIQNFSVMENLEFTEEEKANLDEAKQIAGLYCDGCQECIAQCKRSLPVNEYMRAYMYTYGYRHYENAYDVLNTINASVNPCSNCDNCIVKCPKGFVVAERITDVSRLCDIPREMIV
jgi:uncharacterized protein